MRLPNKHSGFTLIEIIIVISIMGIIGGLSTLIIGRSLDSYAALERRTDLQTSIRLAVERISRELRHALPNSICVNNSGACITGTGAGTQFYFNPIKDSGRYQDRPGVYPLSPPSPIQRARLPVAPLSRDHFDILSTNVANPIDAITGDWVVVYNIDNSSIYDITKNVRQSIKTINPAGIGPKEIQNDADATNNVEVVEFNSAVSFANHSPSRRFHIIDNNKQVTLFYYDAPNKLLFRDTTTFANPNTPSANKRLLMQNVDACSFTYTPGSQQRAGLLRIDITIEKQGEKIQVIHDAHVYNTP